MELRLSCTNSSIWSVSPSVPSVYDFVLWRKVWDWEKKHGKSTLKAYILSGEDFFMLKCYRWIIKYTLICPESKAWNWLIINDCTYKSVIIIWACLKTAFNRTAITDDQRYYILSQDMYGFLHTCESLLLQFPLSISPHATMQSANYMVSCFRYCNPSVE